MLVLTRKQGQQLQIGDDVTITVLEVKGRVIKLGIEAPSRVRVLRGELQRFNEPAKERVEHQPAPDTVAV